MDLENYTIQDYLKAPIPCRCGRIHSTQLKYVEIDNGVLCLIPSLISKEGYKKVFLVSDCHTYIVACRNIEKYLTQAGISFVSELLPGDPVVPDENTLGHLLAAFDPSCDLIIGVGSGTINDICKFCSYQLQRNYFIVATAPSMDGFASSGAALITKSLKTTYDTHTPQAIIADLDLLCSAPMKMISAGIGDILGKYTCLCDWKISHIINREYHCATIENMVRYSIKKVLSSLDQVKKRSPEAIRSITEALILTGIAMGFVGNSRPASGSEHHISHYWEMKFLFEGKQSVLHGTKVGISTIAILHLYETLLSTKIDWQKAEDYRFEQKAWEDLMLESYDMAGPSVIALEKKVKKNDPDEQAKRIKVIRENWGTICQVIKESLIPSDVVREALVSLDAPYKPSQIGVDDELLSNSIIVAKEVRDRYTLLQLLWDLGLSEQLSRSLPSFFSKL